MQEEWAIVHQGSDRQACSDRALVLHAISIPYKILSDGDSYCALAVPGPLSEKAKFEIWEYEQENRPSPPTATPMVPDHEKAIPGVIAYIIIVVAVAWMSGRGTFGADWLGAGRIDGSLIRDGQWWRVVTALTLHGGIKHILGNIVFGTVLGLFVGGLIGPGIAWFAIVGAGALGNTLNVFLLESGHRSIGASTAVFAALGIVSGFVWRAKLMAQDRWAWRLGPIVGGIALLAYTGTGDANTDVGAHLAGFVCGFAAGMILTIWPDIRSSQTMQIAGGVLALGIVFTSWFIALLSWN